jgi:hypothetical protein
MKKLNRLSVFLLASFNLFAFAGNELPPQYQTVSDQLKYYRNYYLVADYKPASEHFLVNVGGWGGTSYEFAVTSLEQLQKVEDIGELSDSTTTGGLALPIKEPSVTPPHLEAWAALIMEKVRKKHEGKSNQIGLAYLGRFGTVSLQEWIPSALTQDSRQKIGVISNFRTKTDEKGKILMEPIGMSMSGFGLLFPYLYEGQKIQPLNFIDHLPAKNIVGKSLFASVLHNKTDPAVINAWNDMAQAAEKTIRSLQDSTYKNPFESLLSRQGAGLLPENLNQTLIFSIRGYARHDDRQKQVNIVAEFRISVREMLAAETVEREYVDPKTGVRINLALSLRSKKAVLKATNTKNESVSKTFDVKTDFLSTDDNAAISMLGSLVDPTEGPNGSRGLTLPGSGEFQSFDFYGDFIRPDIIISSETGCEAGVKR